MAKKLNDSMAFSGGAEETPLVRVARFRAPGSLHDRSVTLFIQQGSNTIHLSPDTMRAILAWYDE